MDILAGQWLSELGAPRIWLKVHLMPSNQNSEIIPIVIKPLDKVELTSHNLFFLSDIIRLSHRTKRDSGIKKCNFISLKAFTSSVGCHIPSEISSFLEKHPALSNVQTRFICVFVCKKPLLKLLEVN